MAVLGPLTSHKNLILASTSTSTSHLIVVSIVGVSTARMSVAKEQCPACGFSFHRIATHLRFSRQCAQIAPDMPEEDCLEYPGSPVSLGCVADDLLDVVPIQSETEEPARLPPDSLPNLLPDAPYNDLDNDDDEMYYNTSIINQGESNQSYSQRNCSTRNSAIPGVTAALLSPGTRSTTLHAGEDNAAVNTYANSSASLNLESGHQFTVPPNYGKSDHCFTSADRSMMRLYNICDKAGSPRYLMDRLLSQIKIEITRNSFDPSQSSLTLRDPFMARMHRKFPSPPPVAILVQLECFDSPVPVYRFDAIEQLQQHLLRKDLYGDLSRLNVDQDDPYNQTVPAPPSGMREIRESSWFKRAVLSHILGLPGGSTTTASLDMPTVEETPADLDPYHKFLLTLEEYKDSTGTDSKEAYSLEPVLMSTGLLDSSFNGDASTRFILGFIPNLSNLKSSASQSRRAGTQSGYGSSVRDYHKCLSIVLQPIVDAQRSPPLLDILLGSQLRRCRTVLVMGTLLGDGKSQDMSCGRVGAHTHTLRLSRAVFTPSDIADDTSQIFNWIKSRVIESVARAALFDPDQGRPDGQPYDNTIEYNQYLQAIPQVTERRKQVAGARRRVRITTEILNKALGSHKVKNAYFALDFASEYGVFGHTLADLMHLLEEGILKYVIAVFLDPLSVTIKSDLDNYVSMLFRANRCHGSRFFPRLNFTRGYCRLSLLSSEERTGAFLALLIVLVTERGQLLLRDRFSVGFDERRKARAEAFNGGKNPNSEENDGGSQEEEEMPPPVVEDIDPEAQPLENVKRKKEFVPTRDAILYVCRQIRRHDLCFLYTDVFPEIPKRHIFQCLKIIWEATYRLTDDIAKVVVLPKGILDVRPFKAQSTVCWETRNEVYTVERLKTTFAGYSDPAKHTLLHEEIPSITNVPGDFLACGERLLALRSFYSYSGEHCPSVVPRTGDGALNIHLLKKLTRAVGESLKEAVNRGEGTNQWRIPKFIDMLLLPEYMDFIASTGRYHVGFCERGLKKWAKMPASTSQKRGRGVFEGQCASRIRENSMVEYALTQMESDDESEGECTVEHEDVVPSAVEGARFHIVVKGITPSSRRKEITCTRLNERDKAHSLQFPIPASIIAHFKSEGHIGEEFEYRTEAVIRGVPYRAHPNFRGLGPWYDFAMVRFDHPQLDNTHVDDNNHYPAKILGFFRLLPPGGLEGRVGLGDARAEIEFSVLVHSVSFQLRNSPLHLRRTLLTRSWLYEVEEGRRPRPSYRVAGTTRSNVVVGEHIFGVEEVPGLHDRYTSEEQRRFIVLSDMRKVWPQVFVRDPLRT